MRKNFTVIFCFLCSVWLLSLSTTQASFAQNRLVKEKVTDTKGGGLPGVNVILKGITTGTSTDSNGDYVLGIALAQAVLTYSYIGFDSQEKTVGNQTVINITLAENTAQLNETDLLSKVSLAVPTI